MHGPPTPDDPLHTVKQHTALTTLVETLIDRGSDEAAAAGMCTSCYDLCLLTLAMHRAADRAPTVEAFIEILLASLNATTGLVVLQCHIGDPNEEVSVH